MYRSGPLHLAIAVSLLSTSCDEKKPPAPEDSGAASPAEAAAPTAATPAADPAVIARGDYLVNAVMACPACHTPFGPGGAPDMSKKFAGGLEVPEVFGTWRSPNITQDKKTGIGGWTDEQIATLLREGKRPNGDQVYPIMPYPFYNALSDDDVKAVVAYLRTIKPIENAVEGTKELKMPKVPVPKPAGKAPASTPEAQGAYLSTIMHCGQCHTPMDAKGAPDMTKAFAGGFKFELPFMGTGELYSSNITPDKATGVGNWTDDELMRALKEQKKKDGTAIQGPMVLLGMGWAHMQDKDLKNVITWMKSLSPIANKVPKSTFKPKPPPSPSASPASSGPPPAGSAPKK